MEVIRYIIFIPLFSICLLSCEDENDNITIKDIFTRIDLSADSIVADGSSTVNIEVYLNEDASTEKSKVSFETSSGKFASNNESKVEIQALIIDKEIRAKATMIAPVNPGTVSLVIRPVLSEIREEYTKKIQITATRSIPDSISLSSDKFGVETNFNGEIKITGKLFNENIKGVSKGASVIFEDFFLDGTPVGGRFRELIHESNSASEVSALYSPGRVAVGEDILLKVTVLDAKGNRTNISDQIIITTIED